MELHISSSGICPNVTVKVRPLFELTLYDVAAKQVSHHSLMRIPQALNIPRNLICIENGNQVKPNYSLLGIVVMTPTSEQSHHVSWLGIAAHERKVTWHQKARRDKRQCLRSTGCKFRKLTTYVFVGSHYFDFISSDGQTKVFSRPQSQLAVFNRRF